MSVYPALQGDWIVIYLCSAAYNPNATTRLCRGGTIVKPAARASPERHTGRPTGTTRHNLGYVLR